MSYERLKQALMDFFSDTSRSVEETKDGLESLREEIDQLLETM